MSRESDIEFKMAAMTISNYEFLYMHLIQCHINRCEMLNHVTKMPQARVMVYLFRTMLYYFQKIYMLAIVAM